MPKLSAGLVVHRLLPGREREVLAVHPGGPFWAKRDEGAWSIPKGEYDDGDDPIAVARREFTEELGVQPPDGEPIMLGAVRQSGGKMVTAFAIEGSVDVSSITSNTFEMEWPPRSGAMRAFPEVDRAEWFAFDDARRKLISAQTEFLDRLAAALGG